MPPDLAPLSEGAFPTYKDFLLQLQDHARAHGYVVTIDKSKHE